MEKILNKIENIFKEQGFESKNINDNNYYFNDNGYYKMTYLSKINSFVIEYAENYNEVINNLFEDGDIYSLNNGEDEFFEKLQKDLIKYYK